MYTAHLSLFCAAALLVSGAYANDSAVADGRTGELNVPTQQFDERPYTAGVQQFAELRRQAAGAARQDGLWLRISEQDTETAVRQPQPIDHTPRWVF